MNLLEVLQRVTRPMMLQNGIKDAKIAVFAISDLNSEVAFISQADVPALVSRLEVWCAEQRMAEDVRRLNSGTP